MPKLVFPKGFLWGSATAAHQVEGNNTNSDWWAWENSPQRAKQLRDQGKNPEEYKSGIACDSYNRYEEDFDIAKSLNQNVHRLSIEWARIEPKQGEFDQEQIEHYRKVLQALRDRSIKTFVTLHHFTNPVWFAGLGGWEKKENVRYFVRYAEKVLLELHTLIDFVCVINEPNVYVEMNYMWGFWLAHPKSYLKVYTVMKNFIRAHNSVYKFARNMELNTLIGGAYNINDFKIRGIPKPVVYWLKNLFYYLVHDLDFFKINTDFIGINYYTRVRVKASYKAPFLEREKNKNLSDFSWEIYPKGIYDVLKFFERYKKPLYITENGIADAADTKRADFIKDHLTWMHRAIAEGADVRGYMHWSLLDNFEWAEGYKMKFGLVEVDRANNLTRKIRPSAQVYAGICKNNCLEV